MILPILLAEVDSQDDGAAAANSVCDGDNKVPQGDAKHAYFFFKGLTLEKEVRSVEDPSCYNQ
jgi:hypothetical protein